MNKSYLLKTLAGFLLAWIIFVIIMHVLPQAIQWLAPLGLALSSFGYAAYYAWSPAKAKTRVPGQASVFVLFGCIGLLLAIIFWLKPASPPSLIMALGYLVGIFLGTGILWLIVRNQSL